MGKKRILMLSARWIYPLDAGYKMRIHYIAKALSNIYSIDFLCLKHPGVLPKDHPFDHIISLPLSKIKLVITIIKYFFKGWPLQVAGYYDQRVKKYLETHLSTINFIKTPTSCKIMRFFKFT